jgi:hypothetical protein
MYYFSHQVHSLTGRNLSKDVKASLRGEAAEAPKPAERQLANLEFWRRQQGPTPVPAPRKKWPLRPLPCLAGNGEGPNKRPVPAPRRLRTTDERRVWMRVSTTEPCKNLPFS